MDRPSGDCAACHVGAIGTAAPQIAYANSIACADAGCHGRVTNHNGTPIGAVACTTCHTAHYETLGACETCHPSPQVFHHGTAAARPLGDCAGCHDGGIATAETSHSALACSVCHAGMERPAVPAACSQCHLAKKFGTATCTTCHSLGGLTGREQVHNATPKAGLTCTGCHAGHNADLGACLTCHGLVPEAHHGVAVVTSSQLTLQASQVSVIAGSSAVLRGTLKDAGGAALSGAQVLLQERRAGAAGFTDVTTQTTGADGGFSQPLQPIASAEYRAVYRGASSSALTVTVQRPAIATAAIAVTQRVRLNARPAAARPGSKVTLAGTVAPSAQRLGAKRPAVGIRIERKAASGWSRVATATVAPRADGTFAWTWRPRTAGTYRARATAAASLQLLAAASPRVTIKVR